MDAIAARLARVERQLRFQRRIITLLIILLVAGISVGALAPIPELIQARKFEVVNAAGRVVVQLESWTLGGRIQTYPAKGSLEPSLIFGHSDHGDGLLLVRNKAGKTLIYAGGDDSRHGLLRVQNKAGRHLIFAGASSTGNGLLVVDAGKEKASVSIQGKATEGGAGLVIKNKNGEEVVHAFADEAGLGYVGAFNRQGKGRVLHPR